MPMSSADTDSVDSAATDFMLDTNDPLYMLLNNTHDKSNVPFEFSLPMDLDFNSIFVNPNALFINGNAPVNSAPTVPIQPLDLLNSSFPFSFSSPTLSSASASTDEIFSGFSTSNPGSPPSARASPPAPLGSGVTADAVPAFPSHINVPLPIPLQPHLPVQHSLPLSPPPPPVHAVQGPQTHVINTVVPGRPKTSHTTIERRYRTNLNARIQSLKGAVPALRVLDQNYKSDEYKVDDRGYIDGVKVARKGSKANVLGKAVEYIRVLKKRELRLKREQDGLRTLICGFPGGQHILTEWEIEWMKEFGGPEKDEIDCEGIEDASDDEDGDGEGEDDGNTSERARKKLKVEASKKEKRKIAPAARIPAATSGEVPAAPAVVGEKRKRGRPRKIQPNVPPPIIPTPPVFSEQGIAIPPMASQVPQPQQYLLAVFALFSFFNSPLTSTTQPVPHHHTHQGSVLSHAIVSTQPTMGWTRNDFVQIIHLLASMAVFVSIVIPWIPVPRKAYQSRLMQLIPFASSIYRGHASREAQDLPTPPDSPDVSDTGSEPDSSSTEYTVRATNKVLNPLINALSSRGAADEFDKLLGALNVRTGWVSMIQGSVGSPQTQSGSGIRHERLAWTRLAELVTLSSEKISMLVRWQIYNHLSSLLRSTGMEVVLVSDLCTLALLAQPLPFARTRAQVLWTSATRLANSVEVPAYHRLVFGFMTVDKAVECLTWTKPASDSSPIEALASNLLRKHLHSHASSLFVHRVFRGSSQYPSTEDSRKWTATLSYGRSLGGDIGLLSDALAKVWQDGWSTIDIGDLAVDAANEGVLALLRAIVLYSRVFASQSVLSPLRSPPTKPSGRESQADVVLHLRRILGSNVFEEGGEMIVDTFSLEDARDRVVDMIVDLQRERRTRAG